MSTPSFQATRHAIPAGTALYVHSQGPEILATNYWDSALDESGAMYCSVNAGAVRLLVSRSLERYVPEMHTAYEVLIRRVQMTPSGTNDALELIWDDGSDSPFTVFLSAPQIDRRIPVGEAGRAVRCLVYVRGFRGAPLLAGSWPGRFSVVDARQVLALVDR